MLTMQRTLTELLTDVRSIARQAGQTILRHYGTDSPIEYKPDNSPLTLADKASHNLISAALAKLTPDIPIVSEESADPEVLSREAGQWLWLVDPLDGTKEFVKQTGQFTVNIGLVHCHQPVLGVIHVPVSGTDYFGVRSPATTAAWAQSPNEDAQPIRTRPANLERLTVVASRDHAGPVVEAFLAGLPAAEATSMGSSLKFCLVAEGKADFYPRVVPTMQWDTAAAQAIVEAAGGKVTQLDGRSLEYRSDRLRNPPIMAFGDDRMDWPTLFAKKTSRSPGPGP
jgi:3'(2'), 5'-bisphosphate nucleotidase